MASAEMVIESLAAGGRGVARPGGKVWFVAGGLPGDRIEASRVRETRNFVEARVLRTIEPSKVRRIPACELQPGCGGCPWMPLAEEDQRRWKSRLVAEALTRLGGVRDPRVDPVQSTDVTFGYRNKVEFSLGLDRAGRPVVGLHRNDPQAGLLDVPRCPIQGDPANAVLQTARRWLLASGRDRRIFDGSFRLVLRAVGDGTVLCAIRETRIPFPQADAFGEALGAAHPEVIGVVRIKSRPGQRGGSRTQVIRGRDSIRQRIAGIDFVLPAATFTQINPAVGERLVRHVVDVCDGAAGKNVFDLYGGVGVLGLSLARRAASVTLCEADREAVRCGRQAASRQKLRNVNFLHGNVRQFLGTTDARAELVVANPPREGLGRGVAVAIAERTPARVLIVSCDPPTLARDVRLFGERGYRLERVTPFDMFPQTAHVETVALLSRE